MLTEEQIGVALSETAKLSGCYNFLLVMDNDGVTEYHSRHNQPCQGGEMRKYDETHTDCTRPQDERPGDLEDPFPDGTPMAVGVNFYEGGLSKEFGEAILSPFSPYRKAVGEHRIVLYDDGKSIKSILFLDLDIDSTLFVNLLQAMRSIGRPVFKSWVDNGFTEQEALWGSMLLSADPFSKSGVFEEPSCFDYYFPVKASLRRLRDGDFHDLTGGTFKDRFDYNRPDVADLFKAKGDDVAVNLGKELSTRNVWRKEDTVLHGYPHTKYYATDALAGVIKEIFAKGLSDSPEGVGE